MQLLSCGFFILIFTIINVKCLYQDMGEFSKDPWRGIPMLCSTEDPKNISISCHGVRIVKRVIQQLLERASNVPSIDIIDGIKLVDSIDGATRRARTLNNPIIEFLDDRELRVRLNTLMSTNLESFTKNNYSEARGQSGLNFGGGKKGGNNFLFLALMMGKMLGVIGFGALGLVTMKALMASSMALMLSLIIAAKKYTSSSNSNDSGGGGGGYHVVYAHEGHHEKRSNDNIELSPYHGWINNHGSVKMVTAR